ncbi:response regulator transcription factor [Aurantibacter crassamenti]|uniref:LytR/AlgR family response regulator transcription factor n=1 Tax=Aurantibacter crassamenti TaxID=1837375 RepID=UPI001939615E|nr:LytTR family DNA-binding domain-containing protein [Aurantibacter crassamenti]MBM1107451.1 response regulator transcription factor [Aurantibacter crassamenti]
MEYSYVIINSDATSNLQLQHYLEEYGDFCLIAQARSAMEGINVILKHSPDVVFVDLSEKAYEYFQMVTELYQYATDLPIFIGISKSKDHAYEAIKNNFFDYWLLPYNEFNIRKSILKLKKLMPKESDLQTLCLKSYRDYHYVDTSDILYLKADNNSTDFVMKDGNIISAYKTLKTYQQQLPKNFVRIHQSYILNTNYVSRINYGKSICTLKLRKLQLPFSKSYLENVDQLKKALSKTSIHSVN